jgi:hypothetical protein
MPFPLAALAIGSSLFSGLMGSRSSDRAADQQSAAAGQSLMEQSRQYNQTRQDLMPYMHIGNQAVNALGAMYGYSPYQAPQQAPMSATSGGGGGPISSSVSNMLAAYARRGLPPPEGYGAEPQVIPGGAGAPINPGGAMTSPDYSNFFASPDYNFRRSEGLRGIENTAAARGGALSGNALRGISDFSSNLAGGEFGNYFNRQASLAGIGQAATTTGAGIGANYAANSSNALMAGGDARASGILGKGASWNNAANGIQQYLMLRQMGYG